MERIRALAGKTLKGFEERMEFGMPYYRRGTSAGVGFASQVQYVSVYVGERVLAEHRGRLKSLKVGKSCVRFSRAGEIDFGLVESMFRTAAEQAA